MHDKFLTLLYCFLTVITINSCCERNNYELISREYLASFTSPNGHNANIVIPISDDDIYVVNVTLLLYTYKHCYKSLYSTETDFLVALYANEINNIKQKFQSCTGYNINEDVVKLDKVIMSEYYNNGLEFIKEKYLNNTDYESFEFKGSFNETVLNIMFMNNYYIYFFESYTSFTKKLIYFPPPPTEG